jgi:5-methylcytosine-specific restriction endonuclease McrA
MPIRPEWRPFYRSAEWKAIRARILERAGNCCERCGAPNRKTVLRQYGWWTEATTPATLWAQHGRYRFPCGSTIEVDGAVIETLGNGHQIIRLPWKAWNQECGRRAETIGGFLNDGKRRWVDIVLTIAHLDHNPQNNADDNLQALCKWCHLKHDVRFHAANARHTRQTRKDAARPLLAAATESAA